MDADNGSYQGGSRSRRTKSIDWEGMMDFETKHTKHTPAPWLLKLAGPDLLEDALREPGYVSISAGDGFYGKFVLADHGFEITGYVSTPNARLIAAAPDLLAALKMARDFIEGEAEQRREQIAASAYSLVPVTMLQPDGE